MCTDDTHTGQHCNLSSGFISSALNEGLFLIYRERLKPVAPRLGKPTELRNVGLQAWNLVSLPSINRKRVMVVIKKTEILGGSCWQTTPEATRGPGTQLVNNGCEVKNTAPPPPWTLLCSPQPTHGPCVTGVVKTWPYVYWDRNKSGRQRWVYKSF